MHLRRLLLLAAILSAAWAHPPTPVPGRMHRPPQKAVTRQATAVAVPSLARKLQKANVVSLPAIETHRLRVRNRYGQVPVGASRPLPKGILEQGRWEQLDHGQWIWRLAIRSPQAAALRIHFSRFAVGRGQVWIYSRGKPNGTVRGPYGGRGSYGDGEFWTPTIPGEAITIEYAPEPADVVPPTLPFQINRIAHIWPKSASSQTEPAAGKPDGGKPRFLAAPCNLDFKCYPEWQDSGSGVALIAFISDEDGKMYICSGSLINTRSGSFIPYFLTANHCVSSEPEARTVESYWYYESDYCNGPARPYYTYPEVFGAHLLATAGISKGDFTLLRLNGLPNRPVCFNGWAFQLDMNARVTGIHHPTGDYKRIAFGVRTTDKDGIVKGVGFAPKEDYYQVDWTQGLVQPGSSGSPLLLDGGYIVGVLSHGPVPPPGVSACSLPEHTSAYGRFPLMYNALKPFLEDQVAPSFTVSPSSLSFHALNGRLQSPTSQSITIRTNSAAPVSWSATASPGWLHLLAASGTVSSATPATLPVTVDAATMPGAGTHTGTVTIRMGTALPQSVVVRLQHTVTRSSVNASITPNPVYEHAPDPEGYSWSFKVRLSETAGVKTRFTRFLIGGIDYSRRIIEWFGTDRIPPYGSVGTGLRTRGLQVPVDHVFEFGGVDVDSSLSWSRRVTVRFLGPRKQALLEMGIIPNPVVQNPASDKCGWKHKVTVAEHSGVGVTLDRWIAGGHDLSVAVAKWFGGTRLAANGYLETTVCWPSLPVPTTIEFELGGMDDNGNRVQTTTQARFVGAATQTAHLSVTPATVEVTATSGSTQSITNRLYLDFGSVPITWSAQIQSGGHTPDWITAYPLSGVGNAVLSLTIMPRTLPAGEYRATLTIGAAGAVPSYVEVPISIHIRSQGTGIPQINQYGVVNGASFEQGIAASTWVTIMGTNLAPGTRMWSASDFSGNRLPTQLEGVSVKVNGKDAYIYYISPTQINLLTPDDATEGPVPVVVTTRHGTSVPVFVLKQKLSPAFFLFPPEGQKYVAAVHVDGTYLGKPHLWPGLVTRPAKPGEVILLFGTGFGLTNPALPTAELVHQPARLVLPVTVQIGHRPANVLFAGLVSSGLYQFNVVVPDLPEGDQPVVASIGGFNSQSRAFITVQR